MFRLCHVHQTIRALKQSPARMREMFGMLPVVAHCDDLAGSTPNFTAQPSI